MNLSLDQYLIPPTAMGRVVQSSDAVALLERAAAGGLVEACVALGHKLLEGIDVPRDANAAYQWFGHAARTGHPMAMNMTGRCLDNGWGVDVDAAAATRFFEQAAKAGLDWGMYNYASALGMGRGVLKDERASFEWFEKAAALGHAKSINLVGNFHEEGRLGEVDVERAAHCYRKAAEGGDFRGQFNHGRLLADTGDIDAAIHWFEQADRSCTPIFRARMQVYLREHREPSLRGLALALETIKATAPANPPTRAHGDA